jgi:hypothetical protein
VQSLLLVCKDSFCNWCACVSEPTTNALDIESTLFMKFYYNMAYKLAERLTNREERQKMEKVLVPDWRSRSLARLCC